jgi:hypothetical protein
VRNKYSTFQRFSLHQTQQDWIQVSTIQFDSSFAKDVIQVMTAMLILDNILDTFSSCGNRAI